MLFNDFIHEQKLKNRATSNIKNSQVLSSLSLSDVGVNSRDETFSNDIRTVNLHSEKGLHWFVYQNEVYFDSYGFSPPQN